MFGRRKREEAAAADAAREAERRALFTKLAERPEAICPFLGLADGRVVATADRAAILSLTWFQHNTDIALARTDGDGFEAIGQQLQLGRLQCPEQLRFRQERENVTGDGAVERRHHLPVRALRQVLVERAQQRQIPAAVVQACEGTVGHFLQVTAEGSSLVCDTSGEALTIGRCAYVAWCETKGSQEVRPSGSSTARHPIRGRRSRARARPEPPRLRTVQEPRQREPEPGPVRAQEQDQPAGVVRRGADLACAHEVVRTEAIASQAPGRTSSTAR